MKIYTVTIEGDVVELDGKYWGIQNGTLNDSDQWIFGPIENATIFLDNRYYKNPTDVAFGNENHIKKLSKSRFVRLKKITTYEVAIDPGLVVIQPQHEGNE